MAVNAARTDLKSTERLVPLANWLSGQVEYAASDVILPRSGRRYVMHLPTEAERERLFSEAREDPEKPAPHWARFWPSGVALADVVLARQDELAGRRVLELGCGLGVTATAVVEAGARLVASDYNPLPLTFCRYNALFNTGRSPRSLRFNWRRPDEQSLIRAESGGGFPIILAADVLYESRDIRPLLALVDRLLAPDGVLWLAEPGRRTAQRFLNTAAEAGWQGVSQQVEGPWPDGSTDAVNIHFLRRATFVDPLTATLGGWRS